MPPGGPWWLYKFIPECIAHVTKLTNRKPPFLDKTQKSMDTDTLVYGHRHASLWTLGPHKTTKHTIGPAGLMTRHTRKKPHKPL